MGRVAVATGLTTEEARSRLATHGANAVQDVVQHPVYRALKKLWPPVPWMPVLCHRRGAIQHACVQGDPDGGFASCGSGLRLWRSHRSGILAGHREGRPLQAPLDRLSAPTWRAKLCATPGAVGYTDRDAVHCERGAELAV